MERASLLIVTALLVIRSDKGWVKTLALTLVAKLELVSVDESCRKFS